MQQENQNYASETNLIKQFKPKNAEIDVVPGFLAMLPFLGAGMISRP